MTILTPYIRKYPTTILLILTFSGPTASAGWRDFLDAVKGDNKEEVVEDALTGISNSDIVAGLKEALSRGAQSAVTALGREDGFLANPKVKIPIPESLQSVEDGLRKLGQNKYADQFVETMNRAAEKAVPEAMSIFADGIRSMSITDAKNILQGPEDAATQYFRRTSEDELKNRFQPIVTQSTNSVGVTSSYKNLVGNLGLISGFIDTDKLDLDNYVTTKALDGLFRMIAEEEKKIRENPASRTTELLKKVFGSDS